MAGAATTVRAAAGGSVAGVGGGGAVADEADDVVEGGVVAELEFVVAFDAVFLADGGEQFGLFDGVDAEVGFHVEVEGQHVGGVAGLFGDQGDDRDLRSRRPMAAVGDDGNGRCDGRRTIGFEGLDRARCDQRDWRRSTQAR